MRVQLQYAGASAGISTGQRNMPANCTVAPFYASVWRAAADSANGFRKERTWDDNAWPLPPISMSDDAETCPTCT